MKSNVYYCIVFLSILFGCQQKVDTCQNGKAIVAGQIINDSTLSEVSLRTMFINELSEYPIILPDKEGFFKYKINLPGKIEFFFSYKDKYAMVNIAPGDSVFISVDISQNQSITFSGDKDMFNCQVNELKALLKNSEIPYSEQMAHYKNSNPENYLHFRNEKLEMKKDSLDSFLKNKKYSNEVIKHTENTFNLEYGVDLISFLNLFRLFQNTEFNLQNIPDNYRISIDSVYKHTIDNYGLYAYSNFIKPFSGIFGIASSDSFLIALKNRDILKTGMMQLNYLSGNYNAIQKDILISNEINYLIQSGLISDDIYEKYTQQIECEYFRIFLANKYSDYRMIQKAAFDQKKVHLFDISKSDTTSLIQLLRENHRGKIAYCDVWATWCGSCISNFKNTSKIKKQFERENIDYVYLAISSTLPTWEKVIKAHRLEGFHYLLNKKQKEELKSNIEFYTIPMYFLIDSKGRIIKSDSLSPNYNETINQISELLGSKK